MLRLSFLTIRHSQPVSDAQFSPDDMRIVTASRDGTAIVWDPETGNPILTLNGESGLGRVSFSSDGLRIVVARSGDPNFIMWSAMPYQLANYAGDDSLTERRRFAFSLNDWRRRRFSPKSLSGTKNIPPSIYRSRALAQFTLEDLLVKAERQLAEYQEADRDFEALNIAPGAHIVQSLSIEPDDVLYELNGRRTTGWPSLIDAYKTTLADIANRRLEAYTVRYFRGSTSEYIDVTIRISD